MARADSGVIPYRKPREDEVISKMWGGWSGKIPWDMLYKRFEILSWLNNIHPLEVQAQDLEGRFTKLFQFYSDPKLYAPVIYYRILPNEIVLDIDCDSVQESWKVLREVVSVLKTLCKFTVGFSGNRGFHVHIIVTARGMTPREFAEVITKDWRDALFSFLLEFFPTLQEYIDTGVMTAKAHTIRSFYSLNLKSGKWKTFVKPFDGYNVWVIPDELGSRVSKKMGEMLELQELLKLADAECEERKKIVTGDVSADRVLKALQPYFVKDYGNYITYHCPFHPPDKHPSFVIFKPTDKYPFWLAVDFHTSEKMSLRRLYSRLKDIRG